jgi:hypothetical protein
MKRVTKRPLGGHRSAAGALRPAKRLSRLPAGARLAGAATMEAILADLFALSAACDRLIATAIARLGRFLLPLKV